MKSTIDISIDPAKLALVVSSLEDKDLGLLLRALVASACGENASPFLNTSGVIIAYGLLSPSITHNLQRITTLRDNGAKGGRPRKLPSEPTEKTKKNQTETIKKAKKKTFPPHPLKKKKIKKYFITLSLDAACAREKKPLKHPTPTKNYST